MSIQFGDYSIWSSSHRSLSTLNVVIVFPFAFHCIYLCSYETFNFLLVSIINLKLFTLVTNHCTTINSLVTSSATIIDHSEHIACQRVTSNMFMLDTSAALSVAPHRFSYKSNTVKEENSIYSNT